MINKQNLNQCGIITDNLLSCCVLFSCGFVLCTFAKKKKKKKRIVYRGCLSILSDNGCDRSMNIDII